MSTSPRKTRTPSLSLNLKLGFAAVAVLNLIIGMAVFFLAGLILDDLLVRAVTAFICSSVVTVLVGHAASDRFTRPIEAVQLAAQTLERNPDAAVPSASGARETDDLLSSLVRSNRQLSAYIAMMEAAINGDVSSLATSNGGSEKLVAAFQKLAVRAADSVGAKRKLDELRSQLSHLEKHLSQPGINGNWGEIAPSDAQVAALASSINALLDQRRSEFENVTRTVDGAEPQYTAAMLNVRNSLLAGEASTENLDRAVSIIKSGHDRARLVADEYKVAQQAAERLGTAFNEGTEAIGVLSSRVTSVQRQLNDLNRKLRKLRERSQAFTGTARSVEDLSRRSNLIAINSSLGASSRLDPAMLANEFTALSDRAQRVQKEIASFEKSLEKEIDDTESMIRYLLTESADLFVLTGTVSELIDRIEPVVAAHSGITESIDRIVDDSAREREELLRSLTRSYFEVEKIAPQLSEAENSLRLLRSIFDLAADRSDKTSQPSSNTPDPRYDTHSPPVIQHRFEVPGEN